MILRWFVPLDCDGLLYSRLIYAFRLFIFKL